MKLLIIPVVGFIMSIPAVIMGRKWYDFITVYAAQSDSYHYMSLNAPNIWSIYQVSYEKMKIPALLGVFAVLGLVLLFDIFKKIRLDSPEVFMAVATWSAWTCVMFLPSMHERYFYIVDILILLLALISPKKYFLFFLAEETISFVVAYLFILFRADIIIFPFPWANVIIYVAFTVMVTINVIMKNREGKKTASA